MTNLFSISNIRSNISKLLLAYVVPHLIILSTVVLPCRVLFDVLGINFAIPIIMNISACLIYLIRSCFQGKSFSSFIMWFKIFMVALLISGVQLYLRESAIIDIPILLTLLFFIDAAFYIKEIATMKIIYGNMCFAAELEDWEVIPRHRSELSRAAHNSATRNFRSTLTYVGNNNRPGPFSFYDVYQRARCMPGFNLEHWKTLERERVWGLSRHNHKQVMAG